MYQQFNNIAVYSYLYFFTEYFNREKYLDALFSS